MPEIITQYVPYDRHTVEEKRHELIKKSLGSGRHAQALENLRNRQFYDAAAIITEGTRLRIIGAGITPWREVTVKKISRGTSSVCFLVVIASDGKDEHIPITADMGLRIGQ